MRRISSRPAFPFLGAALLLALAAVCALRFAAYPAAVLFAALGLISFHLAKPAPEPVRIRAASARRLP